MEREAEWKKEEEEGPLVRTRKGKSLNVQDEGRIVYLDEEEGTWRCRHCSLNYRMGSHGMGYVHSHEEVFREVANAKTLSQMRTCFFSPSKGMWKRRHCSLNYRMGSHGMGYVHSHEEFVREVVNAKTLSHMGTCLFSPSKGMWKCRHYSLNYRMGSHGKGYVHSHEEFVREVANAKTLSHMGTCLFSPSKGTELTEENAGTDFSTVVPATAENNHGIGEPDVEIKNLDILNGLESADENLPQEAKISGLQSCNETPQKDVADSAQKNFESVEITRIDGKSPLNMKSESRLDSNSIYSEAYEGSGMSALEPIKGVINGSSHGILVHNGKAIVEMDVERVLEEQDTDDLYCPNCNSCIAKRVMLRKRKRTIGGVLSGTKKERTEPILQPGLSESTAATDEASHETGTDACRCLSCFSISIPTDGFKSFWIFRRNKQRENLQRPQQTPAKCLSWISAIFEPFRAKEPGRETSECAQEDNLQASGQLQSPSKTQTGVGINHVSPVQGELIPGKSKASAAESVRSETQKPSQERSQGPSEPRETHQVANGVKWNGSNGTGDVNEEQEQLDAKNNSNDFASPFSETLLVTDGRNSSGKVPQVGGNMSIRGVLSPNEVLITGKRPQESAAAIPAVPGRETSGFAPEDNLQGSGQLQSPSETQTGVEISHVSPVQGELLPGNSKASTAESVGSEAQKPSQETSQEAASILPDEEAIVSPEGAVSPQKVDATGRNYSKTLFYYISIGVTLSGASYVAGQLLNQLLRKTRQ